MTVPLRSYLVTRKFSRTLQILPDWINDTKNCNVKLTVLIFSTERAPDNILRTVSNLECNFPTLTKFLTLQQQTRHKNVVERLPFWDLHVVEAAVCKWTRPYQHYFLIEFRTFNLFLNSIYPTDSFSVASVSMQLFLSYRYRLLLFRIDIRYNRSDYI